MCSLTGALTNMCAYDVVELFLGMFEAGHQIRFMNQPSLREGAHMFVGKLVGAVCVYNNWHDVRFGCELNPSF